MKRRIIYYLIATLVMALSAYTAGAVPAQDPDYAPPTHLPEHRPEGLYGPHHPSLEQLIDKAAIPSYAKKIATDLWQLEIAKMDGQSITIVSVVVALILLLLGVWLARRLSSAIKQKLIYRMHMERSLSDAIEKVIYYLLLVIVTLAVLDIAHVPLTVFTLIGGALAIGVGLGSQNILNNFISGLIIMIERSIRMGDIIEVDGKSGTVVNIGARCTQIRTYNNFDILIPNSRLLETSIVNLTLSEGGLVHLGTRVSVMQHNAPEVVEAAILRAVASVSDVTQLESKAPQVFLDSFDEGVMNFEVFYWSDITGKIERRRILSAINKAIIRSLHAYGIRVSAPLRSVVQADDMVGLSSEKAPAKG
jgi:potassium efflux system protein